MKRAHDYPDNNKRNRGRKRYCDVPGCVDGCTAYLKVHAYKEHIPSVFGVLENNLGAEVQQLRLQALKQAVEWILGPTAGFTDLMNFINSEPVMGKTEDVRRDNAAWSHMVDFSRYIGQPIPDCFIMTPMRHIASLLHWKVLYSIATLLKADQREHWRSQFAMPVSAQPKAVDALFYPDNLLKEANVSLASLSDILTLGHFSRKVKLTSVIACFSDPNTYPTGAEMTDFPPEFVVTVGFHPRYASKSAGYIDTAIDDLKTLIASPYVAAIGEIGLDHSVEYERWADQMYLVEQLVPIIPPDKVLLIHCKGMEGDSGMETHLLLIHLLKPLSKIQKIHVHGFHGNQQIINWWCEAFPHTYFSFNRCVENFTDEQLTALKHVPVDRILIETAAPYFPREARPYSAPSEVGAVADIVAKQRNVSFNQMLRITRKNAIRLYNIMDA